MTSSTISRNVTYLRAPGPAPISAARRRIVAATILLIIAFAVTPASSWLAAIDAIPASLALLADPAFIPAAIAGLAIAVAIWTSARYAALLKRNSIQSAGAVRRFSTRSLSIYDPETGFCTFSYFLSRLDEELARSERSGAAFSLLLIEPSFGNSKTLQQALCLALEKAFRTADLVGRLTDDTFAVLLVDTPRVGAAAVVERLQSELGRNVAIRSATYPDDGTDRRALMVAMGATTGVELPDAEAVWSPDGESAFDQRSGVERRSGERRGAA